MSHLPAPGSEPTGVQRADAPRHVFDETPESMLTGPGGLGTLGEPAYRVKQVLDWVYRNGANSFDEMTNLSKRLRAHLSETFALFQSSIIRHNRSSDGTHKLLLQWPDGATSECVMIPDADRCTACISTQIGCPVGCVFCASGLGGLDRQLTAGQIVEQAMHAARLCKPRRLTNVVFMGLGEPLHNYAATVKAVRTINAEWGMNIAARKITISTVGLPRQMKRLAEEGMQVTLALSLHAPDDDLRRQIIPWAESISIDALVEAASHYFQCTGREITLEYVLLGGLNDQPAHARRLADIAKRMRCNVNLIRYNPVAGLPYERPTADAAAAFQRILGERGVNTHVRRSRGLDIDGACGQLRRRDSADRERR